ncbi:hypothetical protein AVEN_172684-1 [Araneus ventricosus]|uniref:Uncharacterized protein n=1 Tax=Araneus ventricosus TaxID=182803 RepID=A0A4Y2QB72_ARAVE|nr:hypothetical protein AVEN_172684-1 [Araneus ventricosus]
MEFNTDQLAKRTRLQRDSSNSEDVQRRFNTRSESIKLSPCDSSTALFIVSPTDPDVTWNHREKSGSLLLIEISKVAKFVAKVRGLGTAADGIP